MHLAAQGSSKQVKNYMKALIPEQKKPQPGVDEMLKDFKKS